jgi:putative drug exporter of the RND superfamily
MFAFLGQFVSRRWPWVIAAWLVLVALVRFVAPAWDDVTRDGDLAFLPASMPSVQGQRLAAEAFAATRSKSELVIIAAREDRKLNAADLKIVDQITARFHNQLGINEYQRGLRSPSEQKDVASAAFEAALQEFDEAIDLDEQFAEAWHNRALVCQQLQKPSEVKESRDIAWQLDPALQNNPEQLVPNQASEIPLVEIWNRRHEIFGPKLKSADRQAILTVLKISNEFMATDNIRVLGLLEEELQKLKSQFVVPEAAGLQFGISGSAAVGGDMLRAAVESIRNTEVLTVVLVVAILLLVYRAPMLVVVPIVTIGVSLSIATGLLALLTQLHLVPGFTWWDFKIFKTTKIFIIVILYGCGTDFCLFLLARLREELTRTARVTEAVGLALGLRRPWV